MTDQDQEEINARWAKAFGEAFIAARTGMPGAPTVLETRWGPLEGTREGDRITFNLPDGREYQMQLLPDGAGELTLFGRVVGRLGPVEMTADSEFIEGEEGTQET